MRAFVGAVISLFACFAHAEITKIALPNERGLSFHWWPKLPPLAGWDHRYEMSLQQGANTLLPVGKNLQTTDAVIYAIAMFKERIPKVKTLEMMIAKDQQDMAKKFPGVVVTDVPPLINGDGKKLVSRRFTSPATGHRARVAYLGEGDFFLTFTLSAFSDDDLHKSMKDYETLITQYRE